MPAGEGFLPLAEAAARLGLSRLKLREGIAKGVIPARRDNEGRWRVDLSQLPADLPGAIADVAPDPAALMEALFDEIEDLGAEGAQARALADRLAELTARQDAALTRAADALDQTVAERDLLAGVADRALSAAEEAEGRATALQATTDRALGLLTRATGAIEGMQAEITRLQSDSGAKEAAIAAHARQLDRLFTLSEQALDKASGQRSPGLIARMLGVGGRR
jgi:methyl-accepting chemotaxis protein